MRHTGYALLTVLIALAVLLTGCAVPTPQVVEKVVTTVAEKVITVEKQVVSTVVVEKEVTKEVEKVVTATPAPVASGGKLTIAITGDIDNFDPHWNQLISYEVLIGHNVFNYLTKVGPDMTVQPDLAEKWEISTDGTVYTFHLRPKAKFHNGRAVTSDDVVYSFNRTTEQKMTFASKLDPVAKIEAVDPQTVKITTKKAWAPFLEDIAVIAIVPKEVGDGLKKTPIGSGPFKFVEWVPNDHITLAKNPDYDGVQPKLDEITIKVLPDYSVALTNLEAGQVNAVYEVPAADAARFKDKKGFTMVQPPASNSIFLFELVPNGYKPLQDPKVRKALAMCLDKEAIQQNVYFGQGDIQWSSLPKSSWAYIEPSGPTYDPEGAKKLLAEAGYPNGFDLQVENISGVAVMENVTTIWQAGLAKAGVNLKINASELSTWLDKYVNRKYQVISNWMNVGGDPHSMYDIIFRPHLTDKNSFPNEQMLGLLEQGASTVDQGRRKAIYAQMQQLAVDEMAPIIVVQSQPIICLTTDKVTGMTMNGKEDIFFDEMVVAK